MEVHSLYQLEYLQDQVRNAAQQVRAKLDTLSTDPLEALYVLKFEEFGYHPLNQHQLNLIEQLNQTFTVMVSLAAARHLITWFPQSGGLRLNLGAARGRDIESIRPDELEAEVFAAVNPKNNRKLEKDIQRLAESVAANRYVFFYSPSYCPGRQCELEQPGSNVQVWALGRREIM